MPQNKKDTTSLPEREWTYRIHADSVTFSSKQVELKADNSQKQDIARRLDLEAVEALSATLSLSRIDGGHIIKVEGELNANVRQKCVVTLEVLEKNVHETFDAYYTNPEDAVPFAAASKKLKQKKEREESPIMAEWEDPEYMEDGTIDLGELVVQYLSLGLNPFPHSDQAQFDEGDEGEVLRQPSEIRKNPFAALQYWNEEENEN